MPNLSRTAIILACAVVGFFTPWLLGMWLDGHYYSFMMTGKYSYEGAGMTRMFMAYGAFVGGFTSYMLTRDK